MVKALSQAIKNFCVDEAGQGINEYAAVLAFVALLVATLFGVAQGTLGATVIQCYSRVASELNGLVNR